MNNSAQGKQNVTQQQLWLYATGRLLTVYQVVCPLCVHVQRHTCVYQSQMGVSSILLYPSQIYSFESRFLTEPGAMLRSQLALTVCICSLWQWVCCHVHCHTQLPSGMLKSDLRHLYHGTAKPTTRALMVAISPAPYQLS